MKTEQDEKAIAEMKQDPDWWIGKYQNESIRSRLKIFAESLTEQEVFNSRQDINLTPAEAISWLPKRSCLSDRANDDIPALVAAGDRLVYLADLAANGDVDAYQIQQAIAGWNKLVGGE